MGYYTWLMLLLRAKFSIRGFILPMRGQNCRAEPKWFPVSSQIHMPFAISLNGWQPFAISIVIRSSIDKYERIFL